LSLKINDQSLVDGTYRSGHDHPSTKLPPPSPPSHHYINYHHVTHQLTFLDHLHPRIHHSNKHHITHRLFCFQPPLLYTLTSINESTTCVVQDCNTTKRLPMLRNIKSTTYVVQRLQSMIIHLINFIHHLLPHINHINYYHITNQLIFLHHLHPRIHHSNHHHITHQIIFLNHHCYTPLHPSTNLQLVLSRDCSATKRFLILRNNKSFIQGVRSRIHYTTSSLTTKVMRTWCLEHL